MPLLKHLILCGRTGVNVYTSPSKSSIKIPRSSTSGESYRGNEEEDLPNYRFADWFQPPPIDPVTPQEKMRSKSASLRRSTSRISSFIGFHNSLLPHKLSRDGKYEVLDGEAERRTPSLNRELHVINIQPDYEDKADLIFTELLQEVAEDDSQLIIIPCEHGDLNRKIRCWYAVLSKEEAWRMQTSTYVRWRRLSLISVAN